MISGVFSGRTTGLIVCLTLAVLAVGFERLARGGESKLDEALASVKIPPDWLADVPIKYDINKPWKDARLHIRKLLGEGKRREAIKLTYNYLIERKVQEDLHEYGMYLFLGGEYAWATKVYIDRVKPKPEGHVHDYRSLATLYQMYGEHELALETIRTAMAHPPKAPWRIMNVANYHDALGDIYAGMGKTDDAVKHYREAMKLLPTAKPPYGRHLLHRRAGKIKAKLDILLRENLDLSKVRDGVYRGSSIAYAKDLHATVTVRGGRIIDIKLKHEEKIEQGATKTVPRRIIQTQSLDVDAVTGATVTTQSIVEATYRALQRGGLR